MNWDDAWKAYGGLMRIADAANYLGCSWQEVRKQQVRIVLIGKTWFVSYGDAKKIKKP